MSDVNMFDLCDAARECQKKNFYIGMFLLRNGVICSLLSWDNCGS